MAIEIPAHELTATRFCAVERCDREVGVGEELCPDHQGRPRPARLLSDPLGLDLGDATFDTWADVLAQVARVEQAAAWWLGDLLRDERFDEDRKYQAAAAATGLKIRRLYTFAWVSRAIPRERRRRELS